MSTKGSDDANYEIDHNCLALSLPTVTGNSTEKEFSKVNRQRAQLVSVLVVFRSSDNQPYHRQTANQQPEAQRVCLSHEVCNGVKTSTSSDMPQERILLVHQAAFGTNRSG